MNLRIGGYYVTRGGRTVGPLTATGDPQFPWSAKLGDREADWRPDGRYYENGANSNRDLVREATIPDQDQWGFLSEYFLECGEDGVVRVKDGRTLEEYINDPRFVKRRKGKSARAMVLTDRRIFERGVVGVIA